jgi:hypothetical protein
MSVVPIKSHLGVAGFALYGCLVLSDLEVRLKIIDYTLKLKRSSPFMELLFSLHSDYMVSRIYMKHFTRYSSRQRA